MTATVNEIADRIVRTDVHLCLSSMVSTIAEGTAYSGLYEGQGSLTDLVHQAVELCAPVLDYEKGARDAGWELTGSVWAHDDFVDAETSAEAACYASNSDPYEWEVYEQWAVSAWLAEKLQSQGEKVDTDFAGLNVWARTTTGQAISMDAVIQRIATDVASAV